MNYFKQLSNLFSGIEVNSSKGCHISFNKAISEIVNLIIASVKKGNKVILIGNGGSASIASHISTDFLKNARIPSITFNDSSLLTCLSNDLGYEFVFQKPIEIVSKKGDILFAISSSGSSENILKATGEAKKRGCFIVTMSGFNRNNLLRKLGDINFYVPSNSYGYVEILHLSLCHCIVDTLIKKQVQEHTML